MQNNKSHQTECISDVRIQLAPINLNIKFAKREKFFCHNSYYFLLMKIAIFHKNKLLMLSKRLITVTYFMINTLNMVNTDRYPPDTLSTLWPALVLEHVRSRETKLGPWTSDARRQPSEEGRVGITHAPEG